MQNLIDAIVPIVIFIAVISGIISSIKEAAAKNAKQVPPTQPSRAQSEIEAFLTGVQSPSKANAPAANQRPAAQRGNRQKPQRQKPSKTQPAQNQARPQPQKPRSLGSGVSEHVDNFIGDHVRSHMGRNVDAHVQADISERVKSHLGSQSSTPVEMSPSDSGSAAADELLTVLKSRSGVRHAILVNEILSKPLSLRKR